MNCSNGNAIRLSSTAVNFGVPTIAVNNNTQTFSIFGGYGASTLGNSINLASNTGNAGNFSPSTGGGTQNTINIGTASNGTTETWSPTGGAATYNQLYIKHRINASGGYSGNANGIFIDPVLTSLTGTTYCQLRMSGNAGYGVYQSGASAKNYFAGIVGIGAVPTADQLEVTGNLSLTTSGNKLKIATGTNASLGTATLVAGTVTVSTTAVTSSSKIFLTCNTPGGTQGFLSAPAGSITNATSFVINSSSASDTSTVNWWIIN